MAGQNVGAFVGVRVDGASELARMLAGIHKDLAGLRMRRGMRKGAEVVQQAISDEAPVGTRTQSVPWAKGGPGRIGGLRDSNVIQKARGAGKFDYFVGPDGDHDWYAWFVHEGHIIRRPYRRWGQKSPPGKSKSGPVRAHVPGNPYIERASEKSWEEAVEAVRKYLAKSLTRYYRKHGVA